VLAREGERPWWDMGCRQALDLTGCAWVAGGRLPMGARGFGKGLRECARLTGVWGRSPLPRKRASPARARKSDVFRRARPLEGAESPTGCFNHGCLLALLFAEAEVCRSWSSTATGGAPADGKTRGVAGPFPPGAGRSAAGGSA